MQFVIIMASRIPLFGLKVNNGAPSSYGVITSSQRFSVECSGGQQTECRGVEMTAVDCLRQRRILAVDGHEVCLDANRSESLGKVIDLGRCSQRVCRSAKLWCAGDGTGAWAVLAQFFDAERCGGDAGWVGPLPGSDHPNCSNGLGFMCERHAPPTPPTLPRPPHPGQRERPLFHVLILACTRMSLLRAVLDAVAAAAPLDLIRLRVWVDKPEKKVERREPVLQLLRSLPHRGYPVRSVETTVFERHQGTRALWLTALSLPSPLVVVEDDVALLPGALHCSQLQPAPLHEHSG